MAGMLMYTLMFMNKYVHEILGALHSLDKIIWSSKHWAYFQSRGFKGSCPCYFFLWKVLREKRKGIRQIPYSQGKW